jgi:uncharacterized Zn-binding protein involved in type VI secretion
MAVRTFKYFTIQNTNTPQPVIGTWITAASVTPVPDFQGETLVTLAVNDNSMFTKGDNVVAQAVNGTVVERGKVFSTSGGNSVVVQGLKTARVGGVFGTGDFLSLANQAFSLYIQSLDGALGNLSVGTSPTFNPTTGVGMVLKMVKVAAASQPVEFNVIRNGGTPDAESVGAYFITGTATDSYLPSIGQV